MSDQTPAPAASAAPPSGVDAGGAPSSIASGAPPAAAAAAPAARPEWLPEAHWDAKANAINPDFGKHYQDLAGNAAKYAERLAAVPEKPEGYKVELKLPDTVKVPEGMPKLDPSKDPRTPLLQKLAHERGWTNDDVNALVALDAQFEIASYNSEAVRLLAEDKKLGDTATERRVALRNQLDALTAKGDITADERAAVNAEYMNAAGVTVIEKFLQKANGGIPGHVPNTPSDRQQPRLLKDILYPQKAS